MSDRAAGRSVPQQATRPMWQTVASGRQAPSFSGASLGAKVPTAEAARGMAARDNNSSDPPSSTSSARSDGSGGLAGEHTAEPEADSSKVPVSHAEAFLKTPAQPTFHFITARWRSASVEFHH